MSPASLWGLKLPHVSVLVSLLAITLGCIAGSSTVRAQNSAGDKRSDKPLYVEYKGVRIGMEPIEVRKKLGDPADKGDVQDFFVFSDHETAQVFYAKGKVMAVSVNYLSEKNAPLPKVVLGLDLVAKPDGGIHKIVRYPEAGYWVSYTRTSGDAPMTIVTMQKIQ